MCDAVIGGCCVCVHRVTIVSYRPMVEYKYSIIDLSNKYELKLIEKSDDELSLET